MVAAEKAPPRDHVPPLRTSRFGRYAFLLAVASAAASFGELSWLVVRPGGLGGFDLLHMYAAALVWRHSLNPYVSAAVVSETNRLAPIFRSDVGYPAFPYLPWYLLAFVPLTLFPFFGLYIGWIVLSAALVAWSTKLWAQWTALQVRWWVVSALVIVAAPFEEIVHWGETSVMVLGLITLSYALCRRRRWTAVGIVAIVALALKPQVAPWLPLGYLLLSRASHNSWRPYLAGTGIGIGAVVGIPLIVDRRLWLEWLSHFAHYGAVISTSQQDVASIPGLERWLPGTSSGNVGFNDPVVWFVAVGAAGCVGIWLWHASRRPEWCPSTNVASWVAWVGVPNTVLVSASPYFHTYDLVTWLPLLIWGIAANPQSVHHWTTWLVFSGLMVTRVVQRIVPIPPPALGSTTPAVVVAFLLLLGGWLRVQEGGGSVKPIRRSGPVGTPQPR
jgi:hypothetical protein